MRFAYETGKTLPQKRKWSYVLTRVFFITNSLNVGISYEYCGPFFQPLNLFSSRYRK